MHLFFTDHPPHIFTTNPTEGTPLQEGHTKEFICRAASHPPAEYSWLKDGVYISNFTSSSILRLDHVQRADAGVYRCIARNEFGSILSISAKLEVACKFNRRLPLTTQ